MPKFHLIHAFAAFVLPLSCAYDAHAAPTPSAPIHDERTGSARIVLVGSLAHDRNLEQLLEVLLQRRGIASQITSAKHFDPEALFSAARRGETLVFVDLAGSHSARLHFRAPAGDRFLLRRLDLPQGVDAVGRELLALVVESSVIALLNSTEGLSRAQAAAAIAREGAPRPSLGDRRPRKKPAGPTKGRGWGFRAAANYSGESSGDHLPLAHGPGLALGARSKRRWILGVELHAQWLFPQMLHTTFFDAEIQRTSAGVLFEVGRQLSSESTALLALGPSLEASHLKPFAAAPGVRLAPEKLDFAPALRGEVRYELAVERVVFGAAALVNISLADTHYDIVEGGLRQRLATLGRVRPGLVITVGVR